MRILYPNDLREPLRRKLILSPSNTSNDKNDKQMYLQCRNPRRIAPFLRILTSQKECISCCPQALYSTQFRSGRLSGNALHAEYFPETHDCERQIKRVYLRRIRL